MKINKKSVRQTSTGVDLVYTWTVCVGPLNERNGYGDVVNVRRLYGTSTYNVLISNEDSK